MFSSKSLKCRLLVGPKQDLGVLAGAIRSRYTKGPVELHAMGRPAVVNAVKAVVLTNAFAHGDGDKSILGFSPSLKSDGDNKYVSLALKVLDYEKVKDRMVPRIFNKETNKWETAQLDFEDTFGPFGSAEEVFAELQPRQNDKRIFLRERHEVMRVSTAEGDRMPPVDFRALSYPITISANRSDESIYVASTGETKKLTKLIFARWIELKNEHDLHTLSVGTDAGGLAVRVLAMVLNDINQRIAKGQTLDTAMSPFVVLPQLTLRRTAQNETHMLRMSLTA